MKNTYLQRIQSKLEQPVVKDKVVTFGNAVDAIHEDSLHAFTVQLEGMSNTIYADIWKFSVNTALRISDLLSLKIEDVVGKDEIYILESKTANTRKHSSYRKIVLNNTAKKIIAKRARVFSTDTYLFQSNHTNVKGANHISRQSVWNAFSTAGKSLGLHTGCHSSRKTLGMKLYNSGVSIGTIQKLLKHSSEAITLQYIGVSQATVDACYIEYEVQL